tara:strand:+ start:746 stop:1195 length:450 start_codon:yes stop_codon:yes gene_type:complete
MSTVILDTITGKSTATTITIGSTPVVSASANSMTIRGEGSAQTSIQQGLCKAWCHLTGTGTPALDDSFNHASITDTALGRRTLNFSSNFGSGNYACGGMVGSDGTSATARGQMTDATPTTSAFAYRNTLDGGTMRDDTNELFALHGDLA